MAAAHLASVLPQKLSAELNPPTPFLRSRCGIAPLHPSSFPLPVQTTSALLYTRKNPPGGAKGRNAPDPTLRSNISALSCAPLHLSASRGVAAARHINNFSFFVNTPHSRGVVLLA